MFTYRVCKKGLLQSLCHKICCFNIVNICWLFKGIVHQFGIWNIFYKRSILMKQLWLEIRGIWRNWSAVTKKSNSHLYYTKVGAFWHLISFFKSNYEKVAYFHRYLTFKNAYLHYSKCDLRWAWTFDPLDENSQNC